MLLQTSLSSFRPSPSQIQGAFWYILEQAGANPEGQDVTQCRHLHQLPLLHPCFSFQLISVASEDISFNLVGEKSETLTSSSRVNRSAC